MDKIPSITDAKAQIDKIGMEAYLKSLYDTPELPKSDRDHNNTPLSLRHQLNKMIANKAGNKPVIDNRWSEAITFLKSVGFEYYDTNHCLFFDVESIQYKADDLLLIEKEHGRNMLLFVLSQDGSYNLYVRIDVGMGFNIIELRWANIEHEWLNHIKLGIQGHPLKYC